QGSTGSLSMPPAPRKPRRRWPWLLAAGVAAAVLGTFGVVYGLGGWPNPPAFVQNPEPKEKEPAQLEQPTVLTVARNGEGDHATIGAALRQAQPGSVIRVLDEGVYEEVLYISSSRLRNVTLEAVRRATISPRAGSQAAVIIRHTPGVTLRGF